jgi:FAD/FMN-containing dehydrogenase
MTEIKDHSGLSGHPVSIFRPADAEELSHFLISNPSQKYRIGAGLTGVSGGAVPEAGECFVDMCGFQGLKWVDAAKGILEAGAGVTMKELQGFAEQSGWFFPVIPGSWDRATLGGMIACNGGSAWSLEVGKIAPFVMQLEVVMPNGKILHLGSSCTKVSEGPALQQLFVGSEGTLGFVCSALLRCIQPVELQICRVSHPDFTTLVRAIPNLLSTYPKMLEMAESDALKFSSKVNEAVVWMAYEAGKIPKLPALEGANVSIHGLGAIEERFDIGKNLQSYKPFMDFDISFPILEGPELLAKLKALLNARKLESAFFGHAGDGNWHVHVFHEPGFQLSHVLVDEFDEILTAHRGHISGEHGIGRIHRPRFAKKADAGYRWLYESVKAQLDPTGQLPSLFP